ncbi:DUF4198 domain-containing protein [Microvirga rosea]|uniref:DUF4198 domain-containing protein n=1 Tax=Microvirga rosea TaxID=2715425 RepID=UPI001D09B035|nr:DUF4198 domain-containing protein [Microvirga rosea]MCB8819589.1 DUF4198 domain-containing protein [Microvirga rosea]
MFRSIALAGIVLGTTALSAQAHGIWVAERLGDLAIVYGHGASDEAYDPHKVKAVVAYGKSGEPSDGTITRQSKNALVRPPENAAALTVVFDNGVWTKGPDGKSVNRPKREVPGAASASHSIKINKTILSAGSSLKPVGLDLEIVPLVDPMTLKIGDDLPVQVLSRGKPLPGVSLNADYVNDGHGKSDKTDESGKVILTVRNDGLNVIGVGNTLKTPDNPDADQISYFATLSFMLPHAED